MFLLDRRDSCAYSNVGSNIFFDKGMTINEKTRLILSVSLIYLFLFGLTGLVVITAINSFQNQNIDLTKVEQIEGEVIDKGKTSYQRKYFMTYEADYVIIQGRKEKFGITKSNVFDNVSIGDRITIFTKTNNEDLNLTIYQVEKDNEVILDKKKIETTEKQIFLMTLGASILMLGLVIWSLTTIKLDKLRE